MEKREGGKEDRRGLKRNEFGKRTERERGWSFGISVFFVLKIRCRCRGGERAQCCFFLLREVR